MAFTRKRQAASGNKALEWPRQLAALWSWAIEESARLLERRFFHRPCFEQQVFMIIITTTFSLKSHYHPNII
jgi:hypothetical protein